MRMMPKAALAAALVLTAATASAQPKEYTPPVHDVLPSLDKIVMESFVSEPATIPPGATQVVLRATVKNVTNSNLATGYVLNGLKLKIFRMQPTPEVLEMETTINNLAAGATQSAGARVNLAPGVRKYRAVVDPDNTLHEPFRQGANNEIRIELTIPQVSRDQSAPPGSTPPKETQLLDYDKAKRSGAQFPSGIEGNTPCRPVGVFDQKQYPDYSLNRPPLGILFVVDCKLVPFGGRATPEAFAGYRLKNGWKVKSFDVVATNPNAGNWEWRKTPAKGSDDPSMSMHVWADGGGWVLALVKVEIEGPAGTNPYQ